MLKARIPSLRSRGTSKSSSTQLSPREEIRRKQISYLTGMINAHLSTKGYWGLVTTFKLHDLSISSLISEDYDLFLNSLSLRVNNASLSTERAKVFFADFDYTVATQMMGYIQYMFFNHPRLLENLSY